MIKTELKSKQWHALPVQEMLDYLQANPDLGLGGEDSKTLKRLRK
ncbi:MAG: hypothetical protein AAB221_07115 [Bacteroidota bacterium]